jgi:hypothetical protein
MAMAEGVSKMTTFTPLSLHTQTMLALLRIYRPDLLIKVEESDKSVLIQVDGLAI